MISERVSLFGIAIDPLTMEQAVDRLYGWLDDPSDPPVCRYVVTPNTDHTVLLQRHKAFREAYAAADLVLADGMPVVWASRLLGKPLPERVTGADLVIEFFAASQVRRPVSTFLLGAMPGVAERAAENIHRHWPGVTVVGTDSPPFGFEHDEAETERILGRIAEANPDSLVVGVGAPKQELWVHRHRERLHTQIAFCVGATIDFIAEAKRRSPEWMQNSGLEWFHRLCSEPRRLAKRYAHDALAFPPIVWREWRGVGS